MAHKCATTDTELKINRAACASLSVAHEIGESSGHDPLAERANKGVSTLALYPPPTALKTTKALQREQISFASTALSSGEDTIATSVLSRSINDGRIERAVAKSMGSVEGPDTMSAFKVNHGSYTVVCKFCKRAFPFERIGQIATNTVSETQRRTPECLP
jgi:hypothetical protein